MKYETLKSIVFTVCVASSLLFSLSALSEKKVDRLKTMQSKMPTSDLEQIVNRGVIRFAVTGENPPFLWKAHGNIKGYEYKIMQAIKNLLGVKLKIVYSNPLVPDETVIQLVKQGKADVGLSSLTINQEDAQLVGFTRPYTESVMYLLVNRKKLHGRGWQRMGAYYFKKAFRAAVVKGRYFSVQTHKLLPKAVLIPYKNMSDAIDAVMSGEADVMLTESERLKYWVVKKPLVPVRLVALRMNDQVSEKGMVVNYNSWALHQWLGFFININSIRKTGLFSVLYRQFFAWEEPKV